MDGRFVGGSGRCDGDEERKRQVGNRGRRLCDMNSLGLGLNFRREEEDFVTEGNRGNGEGKRKFREMGEGRESGEGRGSRVWPGNRKRGGMEGEESPEKETVEKVEGERGGSWRRWTGVVRRRGRLWRRWICSWEFVEGSRRCAWGGR